MRPIVRGLVVVAVASMFAFGCSDDGSSTSSESPPPTTPATSASTVVDASTRVELTAEATSPGTGAGVVEVEGTATVSNGVRVNWALTSLPKPDTCPVDVDPEDDPCNAPYGSVAVTDEQFRFRVDAVDPGGFELSSAWVPSPTRPNPWSSLSGTESWASA